MPEPTPHRRLTPYLVATAAVLGMAGVRWLLAPLLGEGLPFITFFPAVFLASWYGGLGPALFATFASALIVSLWFIPPVGALAVTGVVGTTGVALFVLVGISTALLGESLHRAYRRAEQQIAAEAALRTSEARFQAMAESSPLGIFITDPDGDCSYTNPAYQRIAGLAQHQALGSGWSEAIHPDDRQRVFDEWYDAARRRVPFRSEHRFAHRDGSVVSTRVNAAEISDGERLMGYVGLVEDVTAQAAAETALKQSEERYRAFIEQTAEGVWRFELEQPLSVTLPEE
ncbi:MAG TPA: PAS domain S-box protein, partial [Gemmatimonadales bacterium]